MARLSEGRVVKVNLKQSWFTPDGGFVTPAGNPHTFIDDWEELLPSTATVVEEVVSEDEADSEEAAKAALAKKLRSMTVAQLHAYADENDIEYESDANKAALIETILAG